MRIILPFTHRHPATEVGAPPDAEWHDVSADPHAYWRLMRDVWVDGEAFMVLEHDVVCRPDVLESFDECHCPWAAFPYSDMCHWGCMEAWANELGCTRFSEEIIRAVPDAVSSITNPAHLDWHNLCDGIGENLRAAGFSHHWHLPPVEHHHMGRNDMTERHELDIEDAPESVRKNAEKRENPKRFERAIPPKRETR